MRALIFSSSVLGLALAPLGVAMAQQSAPGAAIAASSGAASSPRIVSAPPSLPSGGQADVVSQVYTEQLTRQILAEEPPARVQRAYRVSNLIDQGQCGPAAQLARAEHDDRMADQVPVACKVHRYGAKAPPGSLPFGF